MKDLPWNRFRMSDLFGIIYNAVVACLHTGIATAYLMDRGPGSWLPWVWYGITALWVATTAMQGRRLYYTAQTRAYREMADRQQERGVWATRWWPHRQPPRP